MTVNAADQFQAIQFKLADLPGYDNSQCSMNIESRV